MQSVSDYLPKPSCPVDCACKEISHEELLAFLTHSTPQDVSRVQQRLSLSTADRVQQQSDPPEKCCAPWGHGSGVQFLGSAVIVGKRAVVREIRVLADVTNSRILYRYIMEPG
jgi:hypothetical protein